VAYRSFEKLESGNNYAEALTANLIKSIQP
jgi:hypothetical protein